MSSLAVPRGADGPAVLIAAAHAPVMLPLIPPIAKSGGSFSLYTVTPMAIC